MRNGIGAVVMTGLLIVVALSTSAVAASKKPTKHKLTESLIGAQIHANGAKSESAYKVHSSLDGTGAGIQEVTVSGTTFPLAGKDTFTAYFADGVAKTKDTFKLGAIDANGVSSITGSGKCVGGTGVHKKETCKYTFTGTYNTKTTVATVDVTGTDKR